LCAPARRAARETLAGSSHDHASDPERAVKRGGALTGSSFRHNFSKKKCPQDLKIG